MVLLSDQGTSLRKFDDEIKAKDLIIQLEDWLWRLHHNKYPEDLIGDIKDTLDSYHIIQSDIQGTSIWLLTSIRFIQETHKRPLIERVVYPAFGYTSKPAKTYRHDRLLVKNLMTLPAEFEMSHITKTHVNAGDNTPFVLKLISLHESLKEAHLANITSFSVFSNTDAISNMNEINGWLKGLNTESADMLINTFKTISLNTLIDQAEICYTD